MSADALIADYMDRRAAERAAWEREVLARQARRIFEARAELAAAIGLAALAALGGAWRWDVSGAPELAFTAGGEAFTLYRSARDRWILYRGEWTDWGPPRDVAAFTLRCTGDAAERCRQRDRILGRLAAELGLTGEVCHA